MPGPRPASLTALLNAVLTEFTDLPLNSKVLCLRIDPVPTSQICKQAQRNWDRRLAFMVFAALLTTIVRSALEIDKRATDRWNGRCGCDRSRARPAVDPEQDEASKISKRSLRCRGLHVVSRST